MRNGTQQEAEQIIDTEISDSANKVRETTYQLWQSLLTVNGFLITLLVGIATFSDIKQLWIKDLLFIIVFFLFLSSILLVLNFLNLKHGLQLIYKVLYEAKMFNKKPNEANEKYEAILGFIALISEWIVLILQFLCFLLILFYLHYTLFSK